MNFSSLAILLLGLGCLLSIAPVEGKATCPACPVCDGGEESSNFSQIFFSFFYDFFWQPVLLFLSDDAAEGDAAEGEDEEGGDGDGEAEAGGEEGGEGEEGGDEDAKEEKEGEKLIFFPAGFALNYSCCHVFEFE